MFEDKNKKKKAKKRRKKKPKQIRMNFLNLG